MKKLIAMTLILAALLFVCGCSKTDADPGSVAGKTYYSVKIVSPDGQYEEPLDREDMILSFSADGKGTVTMKLYSKPSGSGEAEEEIYTKSFAWTQSGTTVTIMESPEESYTAILSGSELELIGVDGEGSHVILRVSN